MKVTLEISKEDYDILVNSDTITNGALLRLLDALKDGEKVYNIDYTIDENNNLIVTDHDTNKVHVLKLDDILDPDNPLELVTLVTQ